MLTASDDYPVHQTSRPVAHPATADPNHYDRYFFNGYRADGSLFFAAALGLYPNRLVIDGAFSVVRGGVQTNVYASGRAPDERQDTHVGPIRVEVVEPLRILRVLVDAPEHGLEAELTFTARTAAVEEPPFHVTQGTRVLMDYTRLTQFGEWSGWLSVGGERIEVHGGQVLGCRDRSWGVRPVGERAGGAPTFLQFFWLWAPVNFDDAGVLVDSQERADGSAWHRSGTVAPVGGGPVEHLDTIAHRVTWRSGTRVADRAEVDLVHGDGRTETMVFEPILEFHMAGIGYTHPVWRHGVWQGESAMAGDSWPNPVEDPMRPDHLHVQALCRVTLGDRVGTGVLEQLVVGPHGPSGFTDLLDPAP